MKVDVEVCRCKTRRCWPPLMLVSCTDQMLLLLPLCFHLLHLLHLLAHALMTFSTYRTVWLSLNIYISYYQFFDVIFGTGTDGCGQPGVLYLLNIYDLCNRLFFLPPHTLGGMTTGSVWSNKSCMSVSYRLTPPPFPNCVYNLHGIWW